jgi:hypothetical protein
MTYMELLKKKEESLNETWDKPFSVLFKLAYLQKRVDF